LGRVVLVTGASRYLGARISAVLADDPLVDRVIAVDVVPPRYDLGSAAFVRSDIRNPTILKVLEREGIDTVVHAGVLATPQNAGGRVSMKETNVIGTMQLLAACQRSSTVNRFVVKSSTTVYGSSPRDPAVFTEEMAARVVPRSGYAKDTVEVEAYVRGFARRRPDVNVVTLRFANTIGPRVTTPLTAYFEMPVVPTALGYDARLQFIHEDDALEILRIATVGDDIGIFNAAGDGSLLLSQALRMAGRVSMPVPTFASGVTGQLFRRVGLADFSPEQVRFLAHGRVVDCTRLHNVMGYRPRYSTLEAYTEFVRERLGAGPLDVDRVRTVEQAFQRALRAQPSEPGTTP
jgi:UDP-glucose 4-epimerase